MVTAAIIFILGGLLYASWGASLVFRLGFRPSALMMLLVSVCLCYEGYALLRSRKDARLWGIVVSLTFSGGSAAIAAMIWHRVAASAIAAMTLLMARRGSVP
jgi:hypothetical protein